MTITTLQKLEEVEGLIEDFRWARDTAEPEARTYEVLKAVARDLRALVENPPDEVVVQFDDMVAAAKATKTPHGSMAHRPLLRLAERLIVSWPAVREVMTKRENGDG